MTDKERAEILRKAADIMDDEGLTESLSLWDRDHQCDYMRACADRLDSTYKLDRSLRGWVLVTEPSGAQHVWRAYEAGIVDSSESRIWKDVEDRHWKVTKDLCFIDHDETAITIPPLSELPEGCKFVRVVLLFESETGRTLKETFERIFDRDDIQRMQDKKAHREEDK